MKHGEKAKGKASKTSGKKARPARAQSSKTVQSLKKKSGQSAGGKGLVKKSASAAKESGGNGKPTGRPAEGGIYFTNPAVGAAFKRAVKKFANAFKRLTD